jgi:hypothetical protein
MFKMVNLIEPAGVSTLAPPPVATGECQSARPVQRYQPKPTAETKRIGEPSAAIEDERLLHLS